MYTNKTSAGGWERGWWLMVTIIVIAAVAFTIVPFIIEITRPLVNFTTTMGL